MFWRMGSRAARITRDNPYSCVSRQTCETSLIPIRQARCYYQQRGKDRRSRFGRNVHEIQWRCSIAGR